MASSVEAQVSTSSYASSIAAGIRLILILLCVSSAGAASGDKLSLAELMQLLASVKTSQARFVEIKHSGLLKSPLVLKGTLSYQRPDRVEKHVLSPYDERITLESGRLTLESNARNETFSIAAAPGAAALVESVRATLAGDLAALRRYYSVDLKGSLDGWSLTLEPRDPPIQEILISITLSGSRDQIRRVEIEEAGGDRSVMEIIEHKA